ncbi:homeobox protein LUMINIDEPENDENS [Ananas comosus]|uniref:Homeobox protein LUMINIDEPENDENS n=1 Tax=Ananas comosus TaxID=4615 RepID=A0A6P5ERH9_ANACO|nr:homeobox protein LUMINIDEPENDENS [Ananas comosus]
MALVPAAAAAAEAGALVESDLGGVSAESLAGILHAQRELFHSQVEELQRLVVAQCKLTGVNPLAQEMAAGALYIKIGKKPRDLLNPKAVKYMQSIFSIKDTIGKKETREISALCGVTVTQVRDFFTSQRSRVRKLVHLSHEKATRLEVSHQSSSNVCCIISDQPPPISIEPPLQTAEPQKALEPSGIPTNSAIIYATSKEIQQGTEHLVNVKAVEGSTKQDTVPGEAFHGVDSEDKTFLDSVFSLMRKDETFSGQVKLMEWILHINNIAVLHWFVTRGGLTILATWLSQAAVEEQTSVLDVIFKVLCHLPLHKALPVDMSAILQTVNRLRFYRSSDISNRAKILLKRWSKLLLRSQALRKPPINSLKEVQKAMICKQRIGEILKDEFWQNDTEIPEDILALTENTENSSVTEPKKALKLLTASSDESTKKHGLTVSSSKTKERRKVLLVEHPERKSAGRNVQVARAVSTCSSRPLSADDIQKAKMRAMYMQNKYGKADASKSENNLQKTENPKVSPTSPSAHTIMPALRISQLPPLKKSVEKTPLATTANHPCHKPEIPVKQKPILTSREHLMEMLKRNQIRWRTPPEVRIDPAWRVGAGENSKELQVQTQRNRREKEMCNLNLQDIPPNPKEPWDTEMDFDDSLTLEIPTEQPPDADAMEEDLVPPPPPSNTQILTEASPPDPTPSVSPPASGEGAGPPGPDLELLAVLLKNPELVFALTSGQGKSLPSEQTVALLDLLKRSGVGLAELVKGSVNGSEEKPKEPQPVPVPVPAPVPIPQLKHETKPEPIPTSLPSPTPPSDPAERINWRSEFPTPMRTPALQPHLPIIRGGTAISNTAGPPPRTHSPVVAPSLVDNFSNARTTSLSMPQLSGSINPSHQHRPAHDILPNRQRDPSLHQNPAFTGDVLSSRHQLVSNIPTASVRSMSPALNATKSMPQSEPTAFPPRVPSWQSTGATSAWRGPQSNLPDVPDPTPRLPMSQNGYNNSYSNGAMPAHRVAFPGRDEPMLDSWSPHGSPRSEFRAGWNPTEQRMNDGRSYRPESSRQWNPGNRDQYRSGSSRRWRDRDRRR